MFLGTYFHTLDDRGRTSVPKKFREQLGSIAIITRGLDGCLFLFSQGTWGSIEQKILLAPLTRADARSFSRHILSGAIQVTIDRLGRILIPDYLLEFVKIKTEIAILGVGERIELWDKQTWENYHKNLREKTEEVAERLAELGI